MLAIRRTISSHKTRIAVNQKYTRANQTVKQREARNKIEQNRWNRNRQLSNVTFNPYRAVFNVKIDYTRTPRFWCLAVTTADFTLALCASREPRWLSAAGRASSKDHEHWAHSRSHQSQERARPYRWLRRARALRHPGWVTSYPHCFPYLVTGNLRCI